MAALPPTAPLSVESPFSKAWVLISLSSLSIAEADGLGPESGVSGGDATEPPVRLLLVPGLGGRGGGLSGDFTLDRVVEAVVDELLLIEALELSGRASNVVSTEGLDAARIARLFIIQPTNLIHTKVVLPFQNAYWKILKHNM